MSSNLSRKFRDDQTLLFEQVKKQHGNVRMHRKWLKGNIQSLKSAIFFFKSTKSLMLDCFSNLEVKNAINPVLSYRTPVQVFSKFSKNWCSKNFITKTFLLRQGILKVYSDQKLAENSWNIFMETISKRINTNTYKKRLSFSNSVTFNVLTPFKAFSPFWFKFFSSYIDSKIDFNPLNCFTHLYNLQFKLEEITESTDKTRIFARSAATKLSEWCWISAQVDAQQIPILKFLSKLCGARWNLEDATSYTVFHRRYSQALTAVTNWKRFLSICKENPHLYYYFLNIFVWRYLWRFIKSIQESV